MEKIRMEKILLICFLSLILNACATLEDMQKAENSIPPIESSGWAVDPEQYGMSAKEYIQSESRAFFADFIGRSGINNFFHFPGLSSAEDKWVVSPNNDTIYSLAIVNTTSGFTVSLPDTGDRFVAIQITDENHMTPFYLYGGKSYEFKAEQFATDYVVVGIRTGTDASSEDVKYIVEQLHPNYKIVGANTTDEMVRPDLEKMIKVREALIPAYDKLPDTFGTMQSRTQDVDDWEKFTYVTAGAWGLSKEENAMYKPYAKKDVKGGMCYKATYQKVPAKAFFSITAYGPDKYLMSNEFNIVSTNQGLKSNEDGTFTVAFGDNNCKKLAPNFLYTPKDNWAFLMRAYRPDVEIFEQYELPEIELVVPVTPENYVRAETDWNFMRQQSEADINTWTHNDRVTKDNQTIIRSNADVVYSLALVDVSKGATLSIPKRENGALQLIHYMDENHLTHGVIYAGESVTITPEDLTGGEYVYILARTKVSDDLEETKTAQASLNIQANALRPYQGKGFDAAEVEAFRNKLINEVYSKGLPIDGSKAFGATLDDVSPVDYYYASALGWGGLPPQHAQYTPAVKGQGSAAECQTITIPKPSLDYSNGGFFSLTTYNSESWVGYDNYHIGHDRMKDNGDGTLTIDFNCDTPYSVTVGKGWNGTFRLYKPIDVQEIKGWVKEAMNTGIVNK